RAIAGLARRGPEAMAEVAKAARQGRSIESRRNAVWAACRVDSAEARAVVRSALLDPEPSVRQAAAHAAGLWRDREAAPHVIETLRGPDLQVGRASAEALGRIGEASAVPTLLRAAGDSPDWAMQHS